MNKAVVNRAEGIPAKRLGRKCFIVSLFVAALMLSSFAPQALAAGWQRWQLDRDRCFDAATIDADGNGIDEQVWFDMDNDCRWDAHVYNTRGSDRLLEAVTFDMNENGVPEYLMLDSNQRVGFEWLYSDLNEDRFYEQGRIIPGSDLAASQGQIANIVNNHEFHLFTMRTGQSLLFPSFPMCC